jgi:hypothetical protein
MRDQQRVGVVHGSPPGSIGSFLAVVAGVVSLTDVV